MLCIEEATSKAGLYVGLNTLRRSRMEEVTSETG
jgi:hypothetical protein